MPPAIKISAIYFINLIHQDIKEVSLRYELMFKDQVHLSYRELAVLCRKYQQIAFSPRNISALMDEK